MQAGRQAERETGREGGRSVTNSFKQATHDMQVSETARKMGVAMESVSVHLGL